MKCEDLYRYGRYWFGYVVFAKDIWYAANSISSEINTELENAGIDYVSIRPGVFLPKEPMVYLGNKPYKYTDFQNAFRNDTDATMWIYRFLNNQCDIYDFSDYRFTSTVEELLQTFVIIVCVAEVGRGYGYCAISYLIDFIGAIINGQNNWGNLQSCYPPATTFAQDERSNWGN